MLRKIALLVTLAFGLAGFYGSSPVLAQSDRGVEVRQSDDRKADPAKMRELRDKIHELKKKKLVEALQLDDKTAKEFFERYRPAQQDIEQMVRERNQALKALRDRIKNGGTDADVDQELKRAQELTKKIQDRVTSLDQDLKPVLTARQRARLLVFERDFNKRVRERVQKMDRGGKQFRDREEIREHLERLKHDHPNWKERMKNERERLRRLGKPRR